ncbi:MAG TPA: hypothetical protein VFV50_04635 [Bdellovibrionales bacterium]|nr:hypothetical protein [Bdellovibrionales bacterium]
MPQHTAPVATFEKLKQYLESRPAAQRALVHLRRGVEISIVIGHQIECTLYNDNGKPTLEKRPAKNHDVVFYIKPESIEVLAQNPGEDVGELGILVLKEYLAGGVRIAVVGSVFNIMKNGYLNIVKEGGATFAKFLANYGLTNATKIISVIKSLRKEV